MMGCWLYLVLLQEYTVHVTATLNKTGMPPSSVHTNAKAPTMPVHYNPWIPRPETHPLPLSLVETHPAVFA